MGISVCISVFFLCTISPVNLNGGCLGICNLVPLGAVINCSCFNSSFFFGSILNISCVPESTNFLVGLIILSVFSFIAFKIVSILVLFGGINALVSPPIAGIICAITGGLLYNKLSLGRPVDDSPYWYITGFCGGLLFSLGFLLVVVFLVWLILTLTICFCVCFCLILFLEVFDFLGI